MSLIWNCYRTIALSLPLTEASIKIRTGGPIDDQADYQIPVWAGEIPLKLTAAIPINDPQLHPHIEVPVNLSN
ncbi:MAG: hypothetical protein V7K26_15870 [Nostoc sp.]|uniref:hypothetical protein n=1 Tax=Nostoc sp. TaxID=1180 RepID=UPI002FF1FB14